MTIELSGLTFGYHPNEPIIRNATFRVESGQFFGVIGPNGGGKSTLLKLLLGLVQPWKGMVSIHGARPPVAGAAYVPQAFQCDRLFPITALEVVLGGRARHLTGFGKIRPADREIALHCLDRVSLLPVAKKPFGSLSGGQAQRVLIARALASEPSTLLLDEPTSSVDLESQAVILDNLTHRPPTMTVVMVSHSLNTILSHVQKIVCVQGEVTVLTPEQVCEHFALGLYHTPLVQTPREHLNHLLPS